MKPRGRQLKKAKIAFNHRQSVIDCLVRNLSETGACLEVASRAGIPAAFELLIEGKTPRSCSLACNLAIRSAPHFVTISAAGRAKAQGTLSARSRTSRAQHVVRGRRER